MVTPLNGIDAPPPWIDLDKICKIVCGTYDHIASIYAEKHFEDFVLRQPLEAFDQLLKSWRKHTILDIGCGPGWEVAFFTARKFSVVGIDASPKMIELAHQSMPYGNFQHMKMQKLEYAEETFDAIWSARTLIHVPKELLVDLLAAWKRVLKPEGIIGVSIIIGEGNGWEREEYDPEWAMFNRYFAEGEIEEALLTAGYHILDKKVEQDPSTSDCFQNHFIFAQKPNKCLDKSVYAPYIQPDQKLVIPDENLEHVISQHIEAGILEPREQVNLCILYDKLANRDRIDENLYRVAAWKLKLHLQAPSTPSCEDFSVWFTLGQLHFKLTQFKQAVACLSRANELLPNNFATLLRLGYSYEGLMEFDKAIEIAHRAKQLAERSNISHEELSDLYHALGHFYVSRSHLKIGEKSVEDYIRGEKFMQQACSTKNGYAYLGCLGSIYNETKRYADAIRLIDSAMSEEKIRTDRDLAIELHFVRAEACMGVDRHDEAMIDFSQVENYACSKQDWDTLAHVRLYQIRASLKHSNISELSLEDMKSFLLTLYQYTPSPYVVESFQYDRERLISILSAFYLLKQCIDNQDENFNQRLAEAIAYMEKICDEKQGLNLLIFADNLGTVHHDMNKFAFPPHLLSFDEAEQDLLEREHERFHVWGVLVKKGEIRPSTLSSITFLIGRAYEQGCTIYVYDPKNVFPESMRKRLKSFFVDSIDVLEHLCYVMVLYDRLQEYLSSTRTALGMARSNIASLRLASQSENIDLLPLI